MAVAAARGTVGRARLCVSWVAGGRGALRLRQLEGGARLGAVGERGEAPAHVAREAVLLQRARPELREAEWDAAADGLGAVHGRVLAVGEEVAPVLGVGRDAGAEEVDLDRVAGVGEGDERHVGVGGVVEGGGGGGGGGAAAAAPEPEPEEEEEEVRLKPHPVSPIPYLTYAIHASGWPPV